MQFNQKRFDAFIDRLGMRHEVNRLREAGATYEMLADVFYETSHPDSVAELGGEYTRKFIRSQRFGRYSSSTQEGKLKQFKLLCIYNGIGTDKKILREAANELGFSLPKGNPGLRANLVEYHLLYAPTWEDALMRRDAHEAMKTTPAKFRIKKEIYDKTMEKLMTDYKPHLD